MQKDFSEKHNLLFILFLFKQFRRNLHTFAARGSATAFQFTTEIRTGAFPEGFAHLLPILLIRKRQRRVQRSADSQRSISTSTGGHLHHSSIICKCLCHTLRTISRLGDRGKKCNGFLCTSTHDFHPFTLLQSQYKRNVRKCQVQNELKTKKIAGIRSSGIF